MVVNSDRFQPWNTPMVMFYQYPGHLYIDYDQPGINYSLSSVPPPSHTDYSRITLQYAE